MDRIYPHLKSEYEFWSKKLGEDTYASSTTIGLTDVLRAHYLLVDYFVRDGEQIGGSGPKDANLLHSALGRQFAGYGNQTKWKTPFEICGTLFFGLVKNHAFYDGNKRTAFLIGMYHLLQVGRIPQVSQEEFELLAVRTAANELHKYKPYNSFRKRPDPEVRFIADFFRRKTRKTDSGYYAITYNQLDTILKTFGLHLGDASGNHIHVLKEVEETYFKWLVPRKRKITKSVIKIGFPGWTREVNVKALSSVRRATKLTKEHGVDSQVFFKGANPLEALISRYHSPLKRLADK